MNLPFAVARRYLFSSRLPVALNLISFISVLGIAFGTALLFIVLSVFNGFESLIKDYYRAYDADIRILPSKGKFFTLSPEIKKKIQSVPEVALITFAAEGRAILKNGEKQKIIRLKGVTADYSRVTEIASLVEIGQYGLKTTEGEYTAVIGSGVAFAVNVNVGDWRYPLELFTVSEKSDLMTADPETAFRKKMVYPAGIFNRHQEYDNQYVYADLSIAQDLFEAQNQISSLEIKLNDSDGTESVERTLQQLLGNDWTVQSRYRQHAAMFEILQNEKAVAGVVIIFMMILISFNIVGVLSMIVSEKRKDIGILLTIGAVPKTIRNIFLWEGFFIGIVGSAVGMGLGVSFCLLQEYYDILSFNVSEPQTLLTDSFPIEMRAADAVVVMLTVFGLTLLSAVLPARRAAKIPVNESIKS